MKSEETEFRRELTRRLAVTDTAKSFVLNGREDKLESLADSLGVIPQILKEAIALTRSGYNIECDPVVGTKKRLFIYTTTEIFTAANTVRKRGRFSNVGALMAALMHAAMQTQREPTSRSNARLDPLDDAGIDFRAKLIAESTHLKKETRTYSRSKAKTKNVKERYVRPDHVHSVVMVSRGLDLAIQMRSTAFGGIAKSKYINLWLADLVDGRLNDLAVLPVICGQMFDSERSYVLPVIFV